MKKKSRQKTRREIRSSFAMIVTRPSRHVVLKCLHGSRSDNKLDSTDYFLTGFMYVKLVLREKGARHAQTAEKTVTTVRTVELRAPTCSNIEQAGPNEITSWNLESFHIWHFYCSSRLVYYCSGLCITAVQSFQAIRTTDCTCIVFL